jgi:acyl carrier protein
MENTLLRLRRLLAEVMRIDVEDVLPDVPVAELFDRYGGDSLDYTEFVMTIEEEIGDLEIPDEEAVRWEERRRTETVRQLAESIDRLRRPPT